MTESGNWRRLEDLFELAVRLDPADRDAFFERHCGHDTQLRASLERLLEQDDEGTRDFLNGETRNDASDGRTEIDFGGVPSNSTPRIGRFRVLEKIGEGGMGVVFRAEQEHPVRRTVALKIVRAGLDTERVLQRFEYERQALARMDHPAIARIFEAGSTETGRPYYAMEFVDGRPINRFCEEEELDQRSRLQLFATICDAVQHAHQKGVLHRDLKPTNILVIGGRDVPEARIIDFGIACETEAGPDGRGLTSSGEVVGTYWAMSPEQADPDANGVDSRTDVYSLGVVLYELLTGSLPFTAERLRGMGIEEIRRILREEEPRAPSVVVREGTSGDRSRRIDADLDWIVLTALNKERDQRYASASELAADVRRYLRHEPITVGKPGLLLRVRRTVRRNRAVVAAGASTFAGLLIGIAFAVFAWSEAERQRDDANRLRRAEESLRVDAERDRDHAESITRFLTATLSLADPGVSLDPEMSARSLLEHVTARIEEAFREDRRGEAAVRSTIGAALQSLGAPELAQPQLRRALDLYESEDATPPEEIYATLTALWQVYLDLGSREASISIRASQLACRSIAASQPELAETLRELVRAPETPEIHTGLARLRKQLASGELTTETRLMIGDVLFELGLFLGQLSGEETGVPVLELALEIRRETLTHDHPALGHTSYRLALALLARDRAEEAEPHAREAHRVFRMSLPSCHWALAAVDSALGECLSVAGSLTEAEELLERSHREIVSGVGEGSEADVLASVRLFEHYRRSGRPEESEAARGRLVIAMLKRRNAPDYWASRSIVFQPSHEPFVQRMAAFELALRSPDEELDAKVADLLLTRERLLPDEDPLAGLFARQILDWSFMIDDRSSDATTELRRVALEILLRWRDENPLMVAHAHQDVGRAELKAGNAQAALIETDRSIAAYRGLVEEMSYPLFSSRRLRARALGQLGRVEEALTAARDLLADMERLWWVDRRFVERVQKLIAELPSAASNVDVP